MRGENSSPVFSLSGKYKCFSILRVAQAASVTAPHPRALAPRSCAAAPRSPRSRHLQTRFGTQKVCATNPWVPQDVPTDWVAGVGQWNASLLLLACCKTLCYQLPRRSRPRGPASSSVLMAPSRPSQERWASSRLSAPRAFSAAARSGVTSESRSATSEQHHRRTQWTRN